MNDAAFVNLDAGLAHGLSIPLHAKFGREDGRVVTEERDVAVAVGLKMLGGEQRAASMIAANEVDGEALGFEVEEHHRRATFDFGAERTGARSRRHHDEPVDAAGDERLDELVLAFSETIGAAGQHEVLVLAGGLLDAAQDRREERVGDVDEDEPDRAGTRRGLAEVSGPVVGSVPERGDGLLDTADQDVAHAAFTIDDARDGLEAHASATGDVAHGGARLVGRRHHPPFAGVPMGRRDRR